MRFTAYIAALFLICFTYSASGQAPPLRRNYYTTNQNPGNALSNVWQFASSGTGTTNDPFRGVESNIAWKPDTIYDWGGFAYAINSPLRLGHENSHHYGHGARIDFHGIGYSNAVEFIATNRYTSLVGFQDFEIHGGTNATQAVLNVIYIDSMNQGSYFRNLKLMDSRSSGMHVIFSVLVLYENIYVSRGGYYRTNSGTMLPPVVKPTNGVITGSPAGGLSGASGDFAGVWACYFIGLQIEDVPGDGLRVNSASQTLFNGVVEHCGGGVYLNNNSGITAEGNVFDLAMEANNTNDVLIVSGNRNRFTGYSGGVVRVIGGTGNTFADGDYNIIDDLGANRSVYNNIQFNWRTNGSFIGGRWTWINCYNKQTAAVITNEWWGGTHEFKHGDANSPDPNIISRGQFQGTGDLFQWMSYTRTFYGAIKSNGYMGLFTSAPLTALDVNGAITFRTNIPSASWTNGVGGIWFSNSGAAYLRTSRLGATNWIDNLLFAAP